LFRKVTNILCCILAIIAVLIMRLIKPWLLVRLDKLISSRIGHFAANTEIYFCERDAGLNMPNQRYMDIFYLEKPVCNKQLTIMWQRVLRIWPAWIVESIILVNQLIPGGKAHKIGTNTQDDRDVHNLLDRFPPHLEFTAEEEALGKAGLQAMGLPDGAQFVCLNVRDSAFLDGLFSTGGWDYHNYRDSDIQNYVLAAEELADRGYFVIRMGVKVQSSINSTHPKVIDYAANGMRSDFMDIYLGAKCDFCISTSSGFDAIPTIYRRPIVFVNSLPVGYSSTFCDKYISITKHHFSTQLNRSLTLSEIFSHGVGFGHFSSDYETKGVELIENTPEEIRDVAIEMVERLAGIWQVHADDEALQQRFWEIFPSDVVDASIGNPLHGKISGRFGAAFLRNSPQFLE